MRIREKLISGLCVLTLLFSAVAVLPVSAYDTPVQPGLWEDANFSEDHAYSFAFVGDTQFITIGDYLLGTEKLKAQYKFIADTADERKLEHVFVLGDMTDWGYRNDANLGAAHYDPPITGEWEVVKEAISQLDGVVPYSLVRGNHDDYMMDDYFNVPAYTNLFNGCGGFYSDSTAKWTDIATVSKSRETKNPEAYVYWSAKSGYHENSVVNSWKTVEISGTKYLFITVDFNPTDNVLNWVDQTLAKYPDHKAIITTHAYLGGGCIPITTDKGNTMYLFDNPGQVLWDEVLSKHANVFMVVSGHVGTNNVRYSYSDGDNGNKVLQVLVDPQSYDTRELNAQGDLESGKQDTGMVLYMNFSADGKTITFDYYSTLLGKTKKYNDYVIHLDEDDVTKTEGDVNLSELEAYGQKNTYVTLPSMVAPTLDGTISANEYTATRTTTAAEAGYAYESDLNEYFAFDDKYIYYAFSIKQSRLEFSSVVDGEPVYQPFTYQFNLKPNYNWADYDELYAYNHTRIRVVFGIDEIGNVTCATNNILSPAAHTVMNMAVPKWDEDIFIEGSRSDDKVNTFELKISKAYFAENKYPDINSIAYMLFLGYDPSQTEALSTKQLWYRWDDTADAMAAMKADGYTGSDMWFYQYMKFITDPIETLSTASVRISDTNSGLRFKSEVVTADLEYYKKLYKTVEVGTLIAPTDTLAGRALTHEIGVDGKDYIDVVADINKPFDTSKEGISVFVGSIVNIKSGNLKRDFTAVGYVRLVDDNGNISYYYSETSARRNVHDVATAAFYDVQTSYSAKYGYLVTAADDVMKGFYSPYSASQRKILKQLIVEYDNRDPGAADIF